MMRRRLLLAASATLPWLGACRTVREPELPPSSNYREPHRPQFHFTPSAGWMGNPTGLVFHNGLYHLFYLYHPDSKDWGPMHWGHATSRDQVHWEQQPIALEPDAQRHAYSGSVVVDAAISGLRGTTCG